MLLAAAAALAAFAAAPEAAAHVGNSHAGTTHTDSFSIYRRGHQLDNPRIVSRPASGDTYWPGETVTVLVPWGWANQASISVNSVGTVHLVLSVGNTTRTLTGKWEDRERRYGLGNTSFRRLYFDYVVRKGDRDTDGVSLAEDALSSPGRSESGIRGTSGSSFRQFELQKLLHGFGAQAGHKVDTPAPSFSGVSGPAVTLYAGGSVSYRLPQIANADAAHDVSYSVTPALPTGLALNTSTAAITGSLSPGVASTRTNYTLRATDGFNRRADLTFSLGIKNEAGIESISITSSPGTDKTYGKNGAFGTNDNITVTVDFTHPFTTVLEENLYLDIWIGANKRRMTPPTKGSDKLYFTYAVQEGDWDGDGISFPANPMGGLTGRLRSAVSTIRNGVSDNRINLEFGAIPDDPGHKVRGRQTVPTFGSTASPAYSWIRSNAVSQQLPAATQGDGGVTYGVKEALPDGLAFAAATRTLSGTPTTAQAAANYTLVATDGDGDKAELRFSIEIQGLSFSISSPSVTEGAAGETAALDYDVTLNRAPGRQVTVDYAAATNPGTASSGTDYTAFAGDTLTFVAAETSKTVTVTVAGDALDEPDETIRIALSNPTVATLGSASTGTGTITDDDPTPTLSLALSEPDGGRSGAIAESGAGNATTVTARLSGGTSGEAITVTVAATPVYAALAAGGGFTLSAARTLTIAAGATASAGTVTVTAVDDAIDSTDKSATVSGALAGGHGLVAAPSSLTLTIADDDAQPRSALTLTPASISETGGVATVTATLSNPSAAAVTLTVEAAPAPGTNLVVGDYTLSSAKTLTIAAGDTASSGTVTITANGNAVDSDDKRMTISATAAGAPGAANPPDATLTILDDDGTPTVSLVLSSSSVSENGGAATVTAALSGTSSEAVTVTVAAAAGTGAAVGDYTLSSAKTLTIAAGDTASSGTVTITANDNAVDSPDKSVTVSGKTTGGSGMADPKPVALTLTDDEATPTARLALSPASVAEAGGAASVTATLSGASSEAVTVTVSAAPGTNAAADDYTLSSANTLTIAAGSTASAGAVTVTAEPDTTDSADKRVTLSGAAAGGNGVDDPADATLTIVDDDALPTLSLALSSATIDESGSGNVATVTAALSHPSGEAVEVAVSVSPAGDFSLSANRTLTIAAGSTASVGAVTVTAADNDVDAPDKRLRVSGVAAGGRGVADPAAVTLTIDDDEALPTVTLDLAPRSIVEGSGVNVTVVRAVLSGPSGEAATVTVTAEPVAASGAVADDFTLSAATTLTIAAGTTVSGGRVTVTAVNNDAQQPDKRVTVSGSVSGGHGLADPASVTLTIMDNDSLPSTTTWRNPSLGPSNNWDVTTASLLGKTASQPIAITGTYAAHIVDVWACANRTISQETAFRSDAPGTGSGPRRCTMLTDNTVPSTITLTQTMIDNDGVVILLSYASGANQVQYVYAEWVPITLLPKATLALSSSSIAENGGVATVTATLDKAALSAATVTVAAAPGSGATTGDFTLSSATTLTFATGATASTGTVTVTAVDDTVHTPDKSVTVSGAVNGDVKAPRPVTLTIADDDTALTATLSLSPSSIAENGGASAVSATLDQASRTAVTVTVTAVSGAYTVGPDSTIVIAAGQTANAGDTATITAVNDDVHQGSAGRSITVTGTAVTGLGTVSVTGAALTLTDDETLPTLSLALSASSISETGGETTVTATLSGKSSEAVTVTVGAAAGTGAVAADFGLSAEKTLTIAAGATASAGDVTITASGNDVDAPDKEVTVSATVVGGNNVVAPSSLTLTLTDDETLPTLSLALSASSISETGGETTVTATLSGKSSEAVTVTVDAAAGTGAVAADFDLSSAKTLTIAAGATASSGDVTVTANDNDIHAPDKSVTVSATATGGNNVAAPSNVTLTLSDDETLPTVALSLSPSSISETGGVASVTATLSGKSSEAVTVTVDAAAGTGAVAADFGLSAEKTLTIAVGDTTSSGDVTITANGNDVDSPDKSVTVSGMVAGGNDVAAPSNVTLTLSDDETLPTLTLALSSSSVSETGGKTTVTATLSGKSSEAVTVTVGAAAGTGAVAADFTLSTAKTLTFAVGATTSAGTVTVTANGNLVDTNDKSVTVSAAVAGGNGVAAPSNLTLTLTDDDTAGVTFNPTTLTLTEEGSGKKFTVVLDTEPPPGTTWVGIYPDVGLELEGSHSFPRGINYAFTPADWNTAQTVSVNALADADHQDNTLRLRYVVAGYGLGNVGQGVAHAQRPVAVTVTVEDDDKPVVTLALSESSISEDGGVATVTATLDKAASQGTTVTVSASPGAGTDFTQTGTKLTIAAGSTASTGVVTITASDDDTDAPDKEVTVSATVDGGDGASDPDDVTLTLADDEAAPGVTLSLSAASIAENGGETTVTAALAHPSSAATTVTVTAATGLYTVGSDAVIVIAAGDTVNAGDTATVEAVDDDVHQGAGGRSATVTATVANDQGAGSVSGAALALTDDETLPTLTLALSSSSISETGGETTVTATLSGKSSEAVTVTVAASPGTGAVAADFALSTAKTLTIGAGSTTSAGDVTVTANGNDAHSGNKSVTVSGTVTGGNNVVAPSSLTLTLTDDETLPTVTLALSSSSVSETGGVSSVTATLSGKSSEAVVVTVGAVAGTGAAAADFALSAAKTLTIAAGSTTSAGTVTVTANGNDVDAPDKQVTVSGTVTGGNNVADPSSLTLTLTDDDVLPTVTLALSPASITESGGVSSVTATLSGASSEAVVVTVAAAAGTGAVAADFALSAVKTLTIAAGSTTSAGPVTVTANGNDVDSPNKSVTVSGMVTGGNGVAAPSDVMLTLADDEVLPTVALSLSSASITESGGVATVTAKLSGKSSEAVTVTVAASPGTGAVAADFALSTAKTLTIAAGTTTSVGAVTVTANDNMVSAAHKQVTVSGTVTGGNNVAAPSDVTLTLLDDDAPLVTLLLSATGIDESGASNVATVTATLSAVANVAATVTVSASPGAGTDFTLAGTKLTIAAGNTTSTGAVTITAEDNATDAPDKQVTVSATVVGGDMAVAPSDVTLTIADDEAAPGVALSLSAASIAENGGETTVSAALSHPSSAATTVTVTAAAGLYTVASGAGATIVIAAGETVNAADTATVTAVDDDVHQGGAGRSTTVTATVANDQGAGSVSGAALALTDDEALPTVALALSSSSISETSGETTVTATLSGKSSAAVVVTVAASPGTGAVAADFALSTAKTLTIAAGNTTSAGDVTVTANGNDVHSGDKSVTVSGTVTGGNGVAAPSSLTLTLTDDETLPTVTLALSASSISETGGVSSVTATLSGKSSQAVTVTVAAAAGTGAVAADFALSAAKTLTIAAGSTTSAGDVTVTANGNDVDSPDKQVTVSGTVTGGNNVADPSSLTLTLTDDDVLPTVTLVLSPASISETGGVSSVTATLSGKSSQAVTVTVGAAAGTGAVAADFDLSAAKTLTIAAGSTTSAGAVTVTANGNTVDSPNKSVTVSGTVAGGNGVAAPSDVTLTLSDDDALPTATLLLSAAAIDESGTSNVTTVTARLDHGSSEAVTVTVSLSPVSSTGAVAGDYTLSATNTLTIAAGATASAGLVTVTAVDNDVDAPNREVTVSGTADGGRGVADPAGKTLTIRDDDGAPGVTLSLSVTSIWENSQSSAVSATLSHPSSAATTVTVTPVAGAFTAPSGTGRRIVFSAGNTTSSHTVPITTVDNDVDEPDRMVTVTATVANDRAAADSTTMAVTTATLTIRDNEVTPTVTLSVNPTSISESGDTATVSATLSGKSSQPTTVTVTAQANVYSVAPGAGGTIVIAAGQTANASDTAIVTAVDNDVDAADNAATVTGTAANGHGVTAAATGASLTFTDDDTAGFAVSPATSTSSRLQTTEAGGTATFTVALESEPTGDVELDLASSDATEGAVSPSSLTFTSTNWNTAQTVTLTGQDDAVADGSRDYQVTLTVDQANTADAVYDALSALTVYAVNADDEYGLAVGAVTGQATEAGGQASFTVALRTRPAQAVTVAVTSRDGSEGRVSPSTLTFQPGSWSTTQAVTVTGLDDDVDDGAVTWQVRLDPASGDGNYNALANVDVSVTTTDDDGPPAVTLALSPSSIDESGTANTAAVRATLSRASGAATTVTVTAVSGFYTVGSDATIVIPAGDTAAASDTAAITAVDDTTDAPDRTETVTATVANDRAAADSMTMAVTGAALTIRDDDDAPNATLSLSPASIAENGGTSAVSATLSHRSSAATTVTVTAVSGFYTVGSDATIVIAAGDTAAASDTAAIAAVDNDVDEPDRTATVTATLGNSQGAGSVTGATLTLTDDETLPVATLALDPASISEAGGVATVTARLNGKSSAAVTLSVAAAAGTGAVSGDFSQSGTTLTIAAGATASAGRVTVTANDNTVATGSKQVTVSATATGGNGVANPADTALTLTDDDTPQVTLALSSSSIGENGGATTVTATLDRTSAVAVTVTVSASPGSGTDFTVSSANTLTFAATATASAGVVTITAMNNDTDAPDKTVTVSGTSSDSLGLANDPSSVTLTITDDDAAPGVTLSLSDASIGENGGTSVVSAALSHPSSAATTVTVTAVSGSFTVPSGAAGAIVIAAGDTTAASDTVTITAVDNDVDEPNRMATVTATAANGQGAGSVTGVTLTLEDDDATPTVTLSVNPASISENGATATVRATLSGRSSQPTTVTVTAQANVYSVASGAGGTIVIAAGQTANASDTAIVTAEDNDVDAADNAATVTGTAANGHGVTAAATGASLTLTDDDVAGIALSPTTSTTARVRTSEDGSTATVAVTLATEPTGNVRINVVSQDTAQGTASPSSLTFTSTNWNTAQTVTLTGVDDNPGVADGSQNYTVSLTVDAANTADSVYDALSAATIHARNLDDEAGVEVSPTSGLVTTEGGGTATFTVRLLSAPEGDVTVPLRSSDPGEGTVSTSSLTFTTGSWSTAQTVVVTGVDDEVDDGDESYRIETRDPSSPDDATYDALGAGDVDDVSVVNRDDDAAPTVTLALTPSTIDEGGTASTVSTVSENGGVATVTATLSHPSGEATTVTVSPSDDYTLSANTMLTIPAGGVASEGTVTVTAVDDAVDNAEDRSATVTGTAQNTMGVGAVAGAALALEDDDTAGLAFARAEDPGFGRSKILDVEEGGEAAYTVALTSAPAGAATVTVTVASDNGDVRVVGPSSLAFTASSWNEAQTVTVRAEADGDDYADTAALTHGASGGGYGVTETVSALVSGGGRIRVEEGTKSYRVGGRLVMVEAAAGVPPGVVVDPGPGGTALTLRFAPVAEPRAPDGFSLGMAATRTVVDISVEGAVADSGLEVCLPATAGLREAAMGRPLLVLHDDGSAWRPAGRAVDPPGGGDAMVCAAGVVSFSPFAVGYVDTRPAFPDDFTLTAMVFTVDEAVVPVTLPLASGGDCAGGDCRGGEGLAYRLAPQTLPPGLAFDDGAGVDECPGRPTYTLCGTPTEESTEKPYAWTVTDVDDEAATLKFTITVEPARAKARARLARINRSILPELSRASWDSAMEAVARRLEIPVGGGGSGVSGEGLAATLAGFVQANEQALEDDASWKEMLSGQSFAVALSGEGEGAAGTGPGRSVIVWGAGDRRSLSRDVPSLRWSGDLSAFHLGADAALGPGVTGGLGVSWFESRMDYVDRTPEDGPVEGVHRSRMASVQPYVGWSLGEGARLWASLGYGSGEIEIEDEDLLDRFGRQRSGSALLAAAAGGAVRLVSDGAMRVDLKGEGQATRYEVDDNGDGRDDLIEGLAVETHRLRVSAQGSREYVLDGGGRLSPTVELGVRWDGGDGATGAGGEVGGGLSWTGPGRLVLELGGRWLVAHRSDVEEWGLSGGLRLEPRANGRGLSLSMEPGWGEAGSGVSRLWEEGLAGRGELGEEDSGVGVKAEVGYGVGAFGGFGVATPYTRFEQAQEGRRYGFGWRLDRRPGDGFELDLGVWRQERDTARPDHGLNLQLRLKW